MKKTDNKQMKKSTKGIIYFIAICITILSCTVTAFYTAALFGLPEDSFGLNYALLIIVSLIVGGIATLLILCVCLFKKISLIKAILFIFFLTHFIAFIGGIIYTKLI